jgi:hypothetical protein
MSPAEHRGFQEAHGDEPNLLRTRFWICVTIGPPH